MNFNFSEEEQLLREQARGFLGRHCDLRAVRKILDGDEPFDRELWKGVVEMGWPAAVIPENYGGLGLSDLSLCVLAEELGRALAPTPFSSTVYLVEALLSRAGSEAQKSNYLPQLATQGLTACAAPAGLTATNTLALKDGALHGEVWPVTDGDCADIAVLSVDGMPHLLDLRAAGVERRALKSVDPTRSLGALSFSGAEAQPLPEAEEGLWEAILDRAAVLFAFEQIGGAQVALDMAVAYAKERHAFGVPIGSFQAIKHKLADMYADLEIARSNAYYAAWALSSESVDLPLAAATAHLSAARAFFHCSKENSQTHGGMGFTWEFDCHLYYRRSQFLGVALGSETHWQTRIADCLESAQAA